MHNFTQHLSHYCGNQPRTNWSLCLYKILPSHLAAPAAFLWTETQFILLLTSPFQRSWASSSVLLKITSNIFYVIFMFCQKHSNINGFPPVSTKPKRPLNAMKQHWCQKKNAMTTSAHRSLGCTLVCSLNPVLSNCHHALKSRGGGSW